MGVFGEIYNSVFADFGGWLNNQLLNNDFLVAGLLAALAFAARNVPGRVWQATKKRLTIVVEINSDNYYFVPIAEALNAKSIKALSRTKVLDGGRLTIGYDRSVGKFGARLCGITREKEQSDSGNFKQVIRLLFPFASHHRVASIFADFIRSIEERHSERLRIYQAGTYGRQLVNVIPKRLRETVYVKEATLAHIERRLQFFVDNRDWYVRRGIPYKHNILLHGPPGNGKTTLVKYLAGRFGYSLVTSSPEKIDVAAASVAPSPTPPTSVAGEEPQPDPEQYAILLEDIDCYGITKERESKTSGEDDSILYNLSTVLNLLDGVGSYDGMLVFATTNHIDQLDAALTRRARFDDIVFVGLLEDAEIKQMLRVFFGNSPQIDATHFSPAVGAEAQEVVLTHQGDLSAAIGALHRLTDGKKSEAA